MSVKRFLFLLMLGAAGALLFRFFFFEGIYIKSESMEPTLPKGLHVFVNKAVYFFKSPQRGEVVMFHTPQQTDRKELVKRVIAVEGDTIEIKKKKVFLNGSELDERYIQNTKPDVIFEGDNLPSIAIPKGHVFVMGDNRDVSGDSRDWKDPAGNWSPYVPVNSIKGRVVVSR